MKKFDLTNPQKSIWFTEEFYKGTSIGNIGGSTIINNKVDFEKLQKAINIFVKNNDALRIKYIKENDTIKQYVADFEPLFLDVRNIESVKELKKIEKSFVTSPFNVLDSFLFKIQLFKFKDGHGGFTIVVHHLIVDAWSAGLIISEILNTYNSLLQNEEYHNPTFSYLDYIESEKKYLGSTKYEKDKEFWINECTDLSEAVTFPGSVASKDISSNAKRKQFTIPAGTMKLINNYCRLQKISPFNFFMGAYALYLSRVTGLDEFIMGTPLLNRSNIKEKHTIGMFINVVPFKININHEKSFSEFTSQISSDFFSVFRHQKYSYQMLLEDLRRKNSSILHLFNILISYQNMRTNTRKLKNSYETQWVFNGNISEDMEIHFFDINDSGIINVAYDYKTSKYKTDDIYALHSRILHIINQILENPKTLLKNIEIVTPDERNEILYKFNNTFANFPNNKTIVELFEEQSTKTPNNIAVVFEEQKLTFKELNEKANQLANYLSQKGVFPKSNIGIFTNRNLESIIGILGILKLNCTYVPIDSTYPQERITYMLEASKVGFVLFSNNTPINMYNNIKFISINQLDYTHYPIEYNNSIPYNAGNNLYIIFTSGSTGKPKGVTISHQNMVNLIYFEIIKTNIVKGRCNILQFATMSFDVSYQEIFTSLLTGNTLYLITDEARKNIFELSNTIKKYNITTLFIPPAYLRLLCDDLHAVKNIISSVRTIITAGEKLILTSCIQNLIKNNIDIYNHYGPAETHVATSMQINSLEYGIEPPIGKPISNTSIFILDKFNNLCPNNTIGQIAIAGNCVGNGYFNNNSLTNSKFIHLPFSSSLVYLTGDLGYYTPDGLIHFIGRNDNQVKINGYRIELAEVESAISSYELITNCIVIPVKNKSNNYSLAAYITAKDHIDLLKLKLYLKGIIPTYMVPSYFMQLHSFKLTSNGKIDRKNLPAPNINNLKDTVPARNEIDTKVFNIVKQTLNINSISLYDNFFEIGGDSLSAINLCAQIQREFNCKLYVKDILENPSLQEISDFISKNRKNISDELINHVEKAGFYVVSSAQQRIYFASNMAGDSSTVYNISGGVILEGNINCQKLEECFKILILRHESLRTYFGLLDGQVIQKIQNNFNYTLDILEEQNFENIHQLFDEFSKPFDLSKAPLFKTMLVKFTNNKSAIFINMHHIISDGTSLSIIIDELCKLYNGENLPSINITYKDYSAFENKKLASGALKDAEEFWINKFQDEIPVLNLPTKNSRPSIMSYEGKKVYYNISKSVTNQISNLSRLLGVTPYMIMLATYYILLSKYTSQDDIVVGTPIVGRDSSQFNNVIGMFVNTLAIREKIDINLTFKEFLDKIKDNLLNCYKYQTYPFDNLVKKLNIKRDPSRNPLFDTLFTYQNNGFKKINLNGLTAKYYIPDTGISKFDLSVEIIPNENGANVSFEYSTILFDETFIKHMLNHYLNIIDVIIQNADIKIANINMLSEEENNKILYEFNNTKMDYPKDKTVIELFEEQVEKNSNNTAVVFEDQEITYQELNKKANSLAHYLKSTGVSKGSIIPILMNRSIDLVISLLAVLKCGGVYLPISPETPLERLNYILQDSNANIVITTLNYNVVTTNSIKTINIESFDFTKYSNSNLQVNINPLDLLYVIYTSGSTGNPKGVKVCHKNLVNFIYSFNKLFGNIVPQDKLLSSANISFDVSIFEIFMPILNGAMLFLYEEPSINDIFKYCKALTKNKITFAYIPPNVLDDVYKILSNYSNISLNKILLGVEPIKTSIIKKYFSLNPNLKIINAYGPTEATICATGVEVDNNILKNYTTLPIGMPLSNLSIFILDKYMQPVPINVPGEIYICGDNVSKGYINNKELTKKSFVSIPNLNCKLAYKTGDFAKWDESGIINFIGRNDSQVKINGHRIELGEIEKNIYLYPNINKVVVVLDNNNKLICYFTCDKLVNETDLKAFLQRKLPSYFIPNFFVQLEEFKLTSNGKIDKKALPKPNVNILNTFEPPKTNYQKDLVSIFETVLNRKNIGINDNFFELGGDSLLAIKSQVEAFSRGVMLSYKDIFKYPTIQELSKNTSSIKANKYDDEYDYSKIDEFLKNTIPNKKHTKNKFKNILLTGATGFMGSHILDAILRNTKANIYCLIRAKDNNDPQIRLLNTLRFYFGNIYDKEIFKRIIVIEGDIQKEKLGFNDIYYEELGINIDCVINSAAIVKHYGDSDIFSSTNIIGTKNIIKFCNTFNCKLFHLSTLSVSGNVFETESYKVADLLPNTVFNEQKLYIGQDLSNNYIYTKFIAERLILENIIDR